jgi:hypothetical protein
MFFPATSTALPTEQWIVLARTNVERGSISLRNARHVRFGKHRRSRFAPAILSASTTRGAQPDIWRVLTDNPHIVIARPPRRERKPKPGPKITRVIVGPHEHERAPSPEVRGKPAAKPAAVIVGRKVAPPIPEEERDHARAEAAERLWRELVRRVEERGGTKKGAP